MATFSDITAVGSATMACSDAWVLALSLGQRWLWAASSEQTVVFGWLVSYKTLALSFATTNFYKRQLNAHDESPDLCLGRRREGTAFLH